MISALITNKGYAELSPPTQMTKPLGGLQTPGLPPFTSKRRHDFEMLEPKIKISQNFQIFGQNVKI